MPAELLFVFHHVLYGAGLGTVVNAVWRFQRIKAMSGKEIVVEVVLSWSAALLVAHLLYIYGYHLAAQVASSVAAAAGSDSVPILRRARTTILRNLLKATLENPDDHDDENPD